MSEVSEIGIISLPFPATNSLIHYSVVVVKNFKFFSILLTDNNNNVSLSGRFITLLLWSADITVNKTYYRPPYILGPDSGNKIWWSKVVSCIHKETPCPNSSEFFISTGRQLLAQA